MAVTLDDLRRCLAVWLRRKWNRNLIGWQSKAIFWKTNFHRSTVEGLFWRTNFYWLKMASQTISISRSGGKPKFKELSSVPGAGRLVRSELGPVWLRLWRRPHRSYFGADPGVGSYNSFPEVAPKPAVSKPIPESAPEPTLAKSVLLLAPRLPYLEPDISDKKTVPKKTCLVSGSKHRSGAGCGVRSRTGSKRHWLRIIRGMKLTIWSWASSGTKKSPDLPSLLLVDLSISLRR